MTLAFVGDAVYELMVREHIAANGSVPANILHKQAVTMVRAEAQAMVYMMLEEVLTEEEHDIMRRGRNANSTRAPKHASPMDYRKATGVEALFGYLYLNGNTRRLEELFALAVDALLESQ